VVTAPSGSRLPIWARHAAWLGDGGARGRSAASRAWHRVRADRLGAGTASARPGMPGAVDAPLLDDRLPAPINVESAAVGTPAGDPAVLHRCLQVGHRGRLGLRDDLVAVHGGTVVSRSPWNTISGTIRRYSPALMAWAAVPPAHQQGARLPASFRRSQAVIDQ
jgi:hypothetical protein